MQTNSKSGSKFRMANGNTMTRQEILALKQSKDAIIASGTYGQTTVHSPIMLQHSKSLITIDDSSDNAGITVEPFDIAIIKATHLTRKFGAAKIGNSTKA